MSDPAAGALTVKQFCSRYGIGQTKFYEEVSEGRIEARRSGRRVLVPQDAADAWLKALPKIEPKPATT